MLRKLPIYQYTTKSSYCISKYSFYKQIKDTNKKKRQPVKIVRSGTLVDEEPKAIKLMNVEKPKKQKARHQRGNSEYRQTDYKNVFYRSNTSDWANNSHQGGSKLIYF